MTGNIDIAVEKLRRGDKLAYGKLYNEFFGVLFSLCLQYTSNVKDSEEIVQDSFLKLWEHRAELTRDSNVKNYLYTITKNSCLNYLRDKQIFEKHLKQYQNREWHYNYEALKKLGESFTDFEELRIKIEQAIDALPDDLRQVFRMNRFEDLKYREIAEKLGLSEKTVEARMSKALKILRVELKDYLAVICLFSNLLS